MANVFSTYANGMTLIGIRAPGDPDNLMVNQFAGLDVYPDFLNGTIQKRSQESLRECMNRKLTFQEIFEELKSESRDYKADHVISCNMAFALSTPSPDWHSLYSYCKQIDEYFDSEYLSFDDLLPEILNYNLANTYGIVLGTPPESLAKLSSELRLRHDYFMKLAVLFDDEEMVNTLIESSPSKLKAELSIDRILASFVIDPFSKVRASRKHANGISMAELYERTINQIYATKQGSVEQQGFLHANPALQYRTAAEHRPEKAQCPETGSFYWKPRFGPLPASSLIASSIDHKLQTIPQYPDFIKKFAGDISKVLLETINSNAINHEQSTESIRIMAEIALSLEQGGVSRQRLFMENFLKFTPGEIMDVETGNLLSQDEYLKGLLKYSARPKSGTPWKVDFLIAAESIDAFNHLSLHDDNLKTLYRIFQDQEILNRMTDAGVESQLGADLGL